MGGVQFAWEKGLRGGGYSLLPSKGIQSDQKIKSSYAKNRLKLYLFPVKNYSEKQVLMFFKIYMHRATKINQSYIG